MESAATLLPAHFTVDTEYRSSGANDSSINASINAGALMASFAGHGNVTLWADAGGPFFYLTDDVEDLNNTGKLPFVTAMNCINSLIGYPTGGSRDSMAEVFSNDPTTGAIAYWSTTALGFIGEYRELQQGLYRTIFQDGLLEFGRAVTVTLARSWIAGDISDNVLKEMLLTGDPSGWLAADLDNDDVADVQGDQDHDDDGLLDQAEGGPGADHDADGMLNAFDPDADNDGLPDGLEAGVDVADPDTDTTLGWFLPDLDPLTTTDPRNADTDGGGAPDGVEDLDADGFVDPGETDPQNPLDDPICAGLTPPEIAVTPADQLRLAVSGDDLTLSWGDASAADPCLLYRVYVAGEMVDLEAGGDAFRLLAVTANPTFTHVGAAASAVEHRYLVAGFALVGGEGSWGHYAAPLSGGPEH
jgi:hypothetical protein